MNTLIYLITYIVVTFTPAGSGPGPCDENQSYITSIDTVTYQVESRAAALYMFQANQNDLYKLYPPCEGQNVFKLIHSINLDSIQQP